MKSENTIIYEEAQLKVHKMINNQIKNEFLHI